MSVTFKSVCCPKCNKLKKYPIIPDLGLSEEYIENPGPCMDCFAGIMSHTPPQSNQLVQSTIKLTAEAFGREMQPMEKMVMTGYDQTETICTPGLSGKLELHGLCNLTKYNHSTPVEPDLALSTRLRVRGKSFQQRSSHDKISDDYGCQNNNLGVKCQICGKKCKNSQSLAQHRRYHVRKWPCDQPWCDAVFSVRRDLTRHLKVHMGGDTFDCPYCEVSVKRKDNFIRHVRRQHENMEIKLLQVD